MRTLTLIAGMGGKCRAKINGSWGDYYSGTKTYSNIVDGTTVSVEALADSGYHLRNGLIRVRPQLLHVILS